MNWRFRGIDIESCIRLRHSKNQLSVTRLQNVRVWQVDLLAALLRRDDVTSSRSRFDRFVFISLISSNIRCFISISSHKSTTPPLPSLSDSFKSHLRVFFRLRNDLYCVEWGVKLYSLTHLRVFNSFPPKIRLSHSIDIFKRHLNSSVYDALVCLLPSASVSNDIIGAI